MLGLILPLIIGVANVYNVTGTWFTFALAFVYIVANVGLYLFYRREHPTEFSWLKHLVVPAIGTIALAVVVYYSVVPLPAWPVSHRAVHRAGLARDRHRGGVRGLPGPAGE